MHLRASRPHRASVAGRSFEFRKARRSTPRTPINIPSRASAPSQELAAGSPRMPGPMPAISSPCTCLRERNSAARYRNRSAAHGASLEDLHPRCASRGGSRSRTWSIQYGAGRQHEHEPEAHAVARSPAIHSYLCNHDSVIFCVALSVCINNLTPRQEASACSRIDLTKAAARQQSNLGIYWGVNLQHRKLRTRACLACATAVALAAAAQAGLSAMPAVAADLYAPPAAEPLSLPTIEPYAPSGLPFWTIERGAGWRFGSCAGRFAPRKRECAEP